MPTPKCKLNFRILSVCLTSSSSDSLDSRCVTYNVLSTSVRVEDEHPVARTESGKNLSGTCCGQAAASTSARGRKKKTSLRGSEVAALICNVIRAWVVKPNPFPAFSPYPWLLLSILSWQSSLVVEADKELGRAGIVQIFTVSQLSEKLSGKFPSQKNTLFGSNVLIDRFTSANAP